MVSIIPASATKKLSVIAGHATDKAFRVIERVDVVTSDGVALEQDISSICKDKDGNLWISTMGQGVFRYNPETARTDNFEFPLCSNDIASVYVDRSNQIWAVTNWGEPVLSVLNKTKDMFEEFNMICDGSKIYKGGLVLLEDSRHRFWMASWTDGLYEIDRITGHVVRHLIPDNVRYGITHIHSLIEYGQDQLAVGSDDGILLYDLSNGKTELFTEGLAPSTGLSNRFVYPLLKDVEGGLWAGTYYGGVQACAVLETMRKTQTRAVWSIPRSRDSITAASILCWQRITCAVLRKA